MTDAVFASLPMPPSSNSLYRNVSGKGRVKTDRYRKWVTAAGWDIKESGLPRHTGPVAIEIRIDATKAIAKKRDLDNCNKAVFDLLVAHQIIEDDNCTIVQDQRTRIADTGGRCLVFVSPIPKREVA